MILGLVLTAGAGLGSWYVFQSLDDRTQYLMAARDISNWERVTEADFVVVEANVGPAAALPAHRVGEVTSMWAAGPIPAGTIITAGLFETPPLAGESDAERVLIQVSLPAGEAPFGTLETGETVALLGEGEPGPDGEPGPLGLIGVLTLEFVRDDNIYYIVSPEEALAIKDTVDRFMRAPNRTILKMGIDLTSEDLTEVLQERAASLQGDYGLSPETGLGPEPELEPPESGLEPVE